MNLFKINVINNDTLLYKQFHSCLIIVNMCGCVLYNRLLLNYNTHN